MKQGKVLESLETILVVTVISALIWLYAEGETISPQTRTVKIRLVPPTAGLVISTPGLETVSTSDGAVELTVVTTIQASRGDWPRIAQRIQKEPVDIEVQVPVSATEDQQINLRASLNQSALAEYNAFVKEVALPTVTARVQQLEEVSMSIRIDKGVLELSEELPPIADPDSVTVTMPASVADVVREQKLELVARLNPSETLTADTPQNVSVKLELPPQLQDIPFVSLAQERANIRFIVQQDTEDLKLPSVPVQLRLPDDITGRYQIRIDPESQRIIQVELSGPSAVIQSIREDNSLVSATIQIKDEDLANGDLAALLMIDAPQRVTVVSPEPGLQSITYTATPLNTQP